MQGIAASGSVLSLPLRSTLFSVSKLSCFPPNKSFSIQHAKLAQIKATTIRSCNDRKFKKLSPSKWDHQLLLPHVRVSEMNDLAQEMEKLKPKIREMLMLSSKSVESTKKRILLIYMLVSLGVAYHFEDEIEESLEEDFEKINEMIDGEDDLYTISIMFWVFRTYCYNMTSGPPLIFSDLDRLKKQVEDGRSTLCAWNVFKRFKGENEKFKESLIGDVKGMVSFYEATHLRTTTDDIIEEALSFTTINLESLAKSGAISPHMSMRIRNSLRMPQHYDAKMAFTRGFISFYGHEEDHSKMLLRFAKINFKFMQLHWIHELETLKKWWKQQDLPTKLPPYFRDRLFECYLYSIMEYFEPRFSRGRIALTKVFMVLTIIDDTCDRYGNVSEVTALLNCVERWDPNNLENAPDYIKTVFKFAWNTFKECESMGRSVEGLSYNVQGLLEEFKILLRANLSYSKWEHGDMEPTFDEFLEIGAAEVGVHVSLAGSFLGLGQTDREKGYKWLKSRQKLFEAQGKKGRLMNDLAGFEDDMRRGCVVNAVKYYMKQYKVTEEEAFTALRKMVKDLQKIENEEIMKTPKSVPREVLSRATDTGKMLEFTYWTDDEYTHSEGRLKDLIESLFFNLISL